MRFLSAKAAKAVCEAPALGAAVEQGFGEAQVPTWKLLPTPPNVPLFRALWSLLDGIWGSLRRSWGVLVYCSVLGISQSLNKKIGHDQRKLRRSVQVEREGRSSSLEAWRLLTFLDAEEV